MWPSVSWMPSTSRWSSCCSCPIWALKELKNPALKGLRFWPVKGFEDFLIFYLMQADTLRVIRILHGKRDIDRILKKESAEDDTVH
jgi:hypothetical protein